MKICVIVPIISRELIKEEEIPQRVENYIRPDTKVDFVFLDYGPASIESRYDEAFAVPFIVKKAEWAEKNNYDAIVISCMMDPAVKATKEAVDIPVVGAGEAARQIALLLGDKIATIYPKEITVLELRSDLEKTYQELLKNAKKALEDGAQVLILGCTGLTGMAKRLQKKVNIPVLEGEGLAIALAELFSRVGLTQSRLAYRKPHRKKRVLPSFTETK